MIGNLSSQYQEISELCFANDYDSPGPPFSSRSIASIDSIKNFLSAREITQARRLETVYFSPVFGRGVGTFIPGLRTSDCTLSLYIGRFDNRHFVDMLEEFLSCTFARVPEAELGGVGWTWFRVTTPDGRRHYPLDVSGNLQGWRATMEEAAERRGTTLAWFHMGKFCLADGRLFSFADLEIDRLAGGKPIPEGW